MAWLAPIGSVVARLVLLPGDLVCNAFGISQADSRDLVRMLVNSLAWMLVSIIVVAVVVSRSVS